MFSALRRRQRASGFFSAIVMTLCLIVLCDGLISQMRGGGSYRIEMLPGTSEAVSGPMADPKAVAGDMEFFPRTHPLRLNSKDFSQATGLAQECGGDTCTLPIQPPAGHTRWR